MKDLHDILFVGVSQCKECGFGTEWQDFTSDNINFSCPNCGSEKEPRLLSDDEVIDLMFSLHAEDETENSLPPLPGQLSLFDPNENETV